MARKKTTPRKRNAEIIETTIEHHPEDESRTVYLVGEICQDLIKNVVERIVALSERDPKKPITMIINTEGGDVDDTFMLYDLMKYITTPIHTVGLGKIMSAGCLLLAAGKKGHRKLGKNARIMYHCGWEYHMGSVFEIRANLAAFERQELQYDQRFADETGLTLQEVEKLYDKAGPTVDHFISATDAVTLGIVDSLV